MYWYAVNHAVSPRRKLSFFRALHVHWGKDRSAHLEASFRIGLLGVGAEVRFDSPSGETPIDAVLRLGPLTLFFGTSIGARLNRWLRVPDGQSREIGASLLLPDGRPRQLARWVLQWGLWIDPEHQVMTRWQKARSSRWYRARRGYINPVGDVLDLTLGKIKGQVETVGTASTIAWLPEGGYPLDLKLKKHTWGRPRSRFYRREWTVSCTVRPCTEGGPGYCPTGKFSYGDDDGLCGSSTPPITDEQSIDPKVWSTLAAASFAADVRHQRRRYRPDGWVPAAPTGVVPVEPFPSDPA